MQVYCDGEWVRVVFPYNEVLIDKCRGLGGVFRKTPVKHWRLPKTSWHLWKLQQEMKAWPFTWDAESQKGAKAFLSQEKLAHKTTGRAIKGLFKYQSAAIDFVMKATGRALIGDDVGLGKTVETLGWMNTHPDDIYPAIIVSPASVVYKWEGEAARWLTPSRAGFVIDGYNSQIEGADIYFMSYNVMMTRLEELQALAPQLLVLDEAHYIKNYKAKRTIAAKALARGMPYVIGLDGTPFLNKPIEMFNTLNIIDERLWHDVWEYGNKYCGGRNFYQVFQGSTNTEELKGRLTGTMIRRLKSEVADQLPPLTRAALPIRVERGLYDEVGRMSYPNRLARLGALYHAVGQAKVPAALEWACDFLEESERKLVVFAFHLDVVEQLVAGLEPFGALYITGEVSQKERADRIARFQGNTTNRVIVINTAGIEGIDLFAASDILFVERLWVPALETQAEGRLHRTGQANPVTAWYMIAKKTIDEKLAKIVDAKREVFKSVLDDNSVRQLVLDEMD